MSNLKSWGENDECKKNRNFTLQVIQSLVSHITALKIIYFTANSSEYLNLISMIFKWMIDILAKNKLTS